MTPHLPHYWVVAIVRTATRAAIRADLVTLEKSLGDDESFSIDTMLEYFVLGATFDQKNPGRFEHIVDGPEIPGNTLAELCAKAREWLYDNRYPQFMVIDKTTRYIYVDLRDAKLHELEWDDLKVAA